MKKKIIIILLVLILLPLCVFGGIKLHRVINDEYAAIDYAVDGSGYSVISVDTYEDHLVYAIEGSAYRTAGGDIAPASDLLWYDLEGRGNCIEVINRMNEYMRSHPEAEVFDNRKI